MKPRRKTRKRSPKMDFNSLSKYDSNKRMVSICSLMFKMNSAVNVNDGDNGGETSIMVFLLMNLLKCAIYSKKHAEMMCADSL